MIALEIATIAAATINSQHLSRYVEGMRDIAPILADAIGSIPEWSSKWIAVTALPKCAVRQAVTCRDRVSAVGRLAIGQTGTGRFVIGAIPDVVEGSNSEWIADRQAPLPQELNKEKYVDDCWVVILMEKDPRTSAFATDPDWFGPGTWHIVHQPASEPGLVPVIDDDVLHPLEEVVR